MKSSTQRKFTRMKKKSSNIIFIGDHFAGSLRITKSNKMMTDNLWGRCSSRRFCPPKHFPPHHINSPGSCIVNPFLITLCEARLIPVAPLRNGPHRLGRIDKKSLSILDVQGSRDPDQSDQNHTCKNHGMSRPCCTLYSDLVRALQPCEKQMDLVQSTM